MMIRLGRAVLVFGLVFGVADAAYAQPGQIWYPSVRATPSGFEVWLATPSTGEEKRIASGYRDKKAALRQAGLAAKRYNSGYVPNKVVKVDVPASVRTTCRAATDLFCELCGAKSGTCLKFRQTQDELYYTVFGHDTCASTGLSLQQAKSSRTAWAERRLQVCIHQPPRSTSGVQSDCDVASKIMCRSCGAQSATCSSIRRWVRRVKPSPKQCTEYREAMEVGEATLQRLPAAARQQQREYACSSVAENLGMVGF